MPLLKDLPTILLIITVAIICGALYAYALKLTLDWLSERDQ